MEEVIYDEQGQLLTRDLDTYPIPRPTDMPEFELDSTVTLTPLNRMGERAPAMSPTRGSASHHQCHL